jgi:hypothetical protein
MKLLLNTLMILRGKYLGLLNSHCLAETHSTYYVSDWGLYDATSVAGLTLDAIVFFDTAFRWYGMIKVLRHRPFPVTDGTHLPQSLRLRVSRLRVIIDSTGAIARHT